MANRNLHNIQNSNSCMTIKIYRPIENTKLQPRKSILLNCIGMLVSFLYALCTNLVWALILFIIIGLLPLGVGDIIEPIKFKFYITFMVFTFYCVYKKYNLVQYIGFMFMTSIVVTSIYLYGVKWYSALFKKFY